MGLWLIERMDHQLDALEFKSKLKLLENRVVEIQIGSNHKVEQWKQEARFVQQKLEGFQQECSAAIEQFEKAFSSSKQEV